MKPLLSASAARHRLNAILPFLHGDVLDLGCGWLSLPDRLTGKQRYIGIDVSPAAVKYNAQRYPAHSYHQRDLDREPLALGDHRFDVVTMIALLEHLRAPEYVLHQIHSVLTPDGLLLITTPSPFGDLVHRVGSRLRLFYPETHVQHVRIYSRGEAEDLVVRCGYAVQDAQVFLAGTNQLLVCRSVNQNRASGHGE